MKKVPGGIGKVLAPTLLAGIAGAEYNNSRADGDSPAQAALNAGVEVANPLVIGPRDVKDLKDTVQQKVDKTFNGAEQISKGEHQKTNSTLLNAINDRNKIINE